MNSVEACHIRPMVADDLDLVLAWRNHQNIRRFMLTQHEITFSEHREWYMRASRDPAKRLFIVEEGERPLGFVHFSNVANGGIADWGFYAAPHALKGAGRKLGVSALNFAFQKLNLHKICGQALDFNESSIHLHLKLGFLQEGVFREQHWIDGAYHDLICFGLLKQEWTTNELR